MNYPQDFSLRIRVCVAKDFCKDLLHFLQLNMWILKILWILPARVKYCEWGLRTISGKMGFFSMNTSL